MPGLSAIANDIPVHEPGTPQVTDASLDQGSSAVDISHAHFSFIFYWLSASRQLP